MNSTARKIALVLTVLVVIACGIVLVATGPGFGQTQERGFKADQPTAFWMERPCEYEDGINCYWDAGSSGNKKGHSFYARHLRGETCLFYTQRWYAKKHDRCFEDKRVARTGRPDFDIDGGIE